MMMPIIGCFCLLSCYFFSLFYVLMGSDCFWAGYSVVKYVYIPDFPENSKTCKIMQIQIINRSAYYEYYYYIISYFQLLELENLVVHTAPTDMG